MIVMDDLINELDFKNLTPEIKKNLNILLNSLNKLEEAYGQKLKFSSVFRSMQHHIEIYKNLANQKKIQFSYSQVPIYSKHLYGQAADILDYDFKLTEFCKKDNSKVLIDCGLWCEEDRHQPRLHVQIVPPMSGKRWFLP